MKNDNQKFDEYNSKLIFSFHIGDTVRYVGGEGYIGTKIKLGDFLSDELPNPSSPGPRYKLMGIEKVFIESELKMSAVTE